MDAKKEILIKLQQDILFWQGFKPQAGGKAEQMSHWAEAIPISRIKLMALSKIKSTCTYHKCIKDLEDLGCIKYHPSHHPKGSLINWGKPFTN